jgi:hypothetical protein
MAAIRRPRAGVAAEKQLDKDAEGEPGQEGRNLRLGTDLLAQAGLLVVDGRIAEVDPGLALEELDWVVGDEADRLGAMQRPLATRGEVYRQLAERRLVTDDDDRVGSREGHPPLLRLPEQVERAGRPAQRVKDHRGPASQRHC